MPMQMDLSRRAVLRIGALSILGAAAGTPQIARGGSTDQKRRSCIFILLQGGPSHHDLWDPKPEASAEIRGSFESIGTSVPELRFGSLLERTALIADRLCV